MTHDLTREKVQYVVSGSHLDTQWRWTIQRTVDEYLPRTLLDNFVLFEKYPGYVLSFEGAYRYMLIKKHYPREYERLKCYVEKGNWAPVGSMVDMPDVNMPCPESLVRQILYGNLFFEEEFGRRSVDIYLPDCFGFGAALPTIGAHCGLKGFSTQKLLSWRGGTYRDERGEVRVGIPFEIGVWEGVDGSSLVAALNAGHYMGKWEPRADDLRKMGESTGLWLNYHYFGVGDVGGAKPETDVSELMDRVARNDGNGGVKVVLAPADQMYKDLEPEDVARLPRYKGELLCTQASGGFYTAWAEMKALNRACELMADAGERARVVTDWLGALSYPREALREAWVQFLWHQMHDDLAGVSIPETHAISARDYRQAHTTFSTAAYSAVKAIAGMMDTRGEGKPCVVHNTLSCEREDVVAVDLWYGKGGVPEHVRVFDKDGAEVPSELTARGKKEASVAFLAKVPPVGSAVFDVRASDEGCALKTGLRADETGLENRRYVVRIDPNGDVCSIHDKLANRELLSAPIRLELLYDYSPTSPAWDIRWEDISAEPREYVGAPAKVVVESAGPLRARLRIERALGASTFTQVLSLAAGGAGEALTVESTVKWFTHERLLKIRFPLGVASPMATYDLGIGVVERGNSSQTMNEVPAQQWADITDVGGAYGVTIMNDNKYGWDKPRDDTLRLTLLHTPGIAERSGFYDCPDHAELDVGRTHRTTYAIVGHVRDWRNGNSVELAARFNRPLLAVAAGEHEGVLGKSFEFLRVGDDAIAVMALKRAERSEEIIVRVRETRGHARKAARLYFAADVEAATEVDGQELRKGDVSFGENYLEFDIVGFQPKAFAVRLKPRA